tara:strand:- start:42901 stop:43524 length:624 start_codon:yes stop_codon:yes gene_type:complete
MALKRISYILLAISAVAIGLYPIMYFLVDRTFGLLNSKTPELLADATWNGMFYVHIVLGGIAILIGWIQFNKKIRRERMQLHRNIGKIYIITVLLSAISGFYIAYHATGGWIAKSGFMGMALTWFFTTLIGFTSIKNKDVIKHQKMMIYSYAVCFAAVTLRVWLPILSGLLGGFLPAYKIVAWLSWIPNLFVAQYIINQQFKIQKTP